eukprot:6718847-Pyramimonas_sp.AAC.1
MCVCPLAEPDGRVHRSWTPGWSLPGSAQLCGRRPPSRAAPAEERGVAGTQRTAGPSGCRLG